MVPMNIHHSTTTPHTDASSWGRPTGVLLLAIAIMLAATQHAQASTDWTVSCPTEKACVAHLDRKGVQILIGRTKDGAPLRMALRLSAAAQKGKPVSMRLNDGWQAGLRVSNCSEKYCEAGVATSATPVAIAALSRNRSGIIAYEIKDKILLIEFTLTGFADALKRVGQ